MKFKLGCNYWASNAGTEMWQNFDAEAIENDIKILSEHGAKYLRVFPNWRDFQPVTPVIAGQGRVIGYSVKNGQEPENEYYLDEEMLSRFSTFLDICDKYDIKLIVGLLTGWMSGALFVPAALYEKNLITHPVALYFEQLFIKGFVQRFKDRNCIYAWDLGNECNCMAPVTSVFEAASWTAMVSNAIKAADNTRPVVSGMHGLGLNNEWTISHQGMFTDILTTHPYPYWCEHTRIDETLSFRTTLHPTAQSKYYSEISKKPCLAEEIGTMGPMICSNEKAADFMRINMLSLFANGQDGAMWWCANDQTNLKTFPYNDQFVELELGMLDVNHNPKPVLKEMKKFADFLDESALELPKARVDAVCVMTRDQRNWGVGYMTFCLMKKAGLNCVFEDGEKTLPDSRLYMLPSINGIRMMPVERFNELKERVYNGADLYISANNAVISEFESFSGLRVVDSSEYAKNVTANIGGKDITLFRMRNITFKPIGAKVLFSDNENNPLITVNNYGKGRVFFVNAPLEDNLVDRHNAFDGGFEIVYKTLFADYIAEYPYEISDNDLVSTYHETDDGAYVVVLNHTDTDKDLELSFKDGYTVENVLYGNKDKVKAFDGCIIKITNK
ncbi:MAG: hypothetical protein E7600_01580 [Ruminococcaceae bacterium]|nr:hypothetical protein [Oscillospiraceae bacterium]